MFDGEFTNPTHVKDKPRILTGILLEHLHNPNFVLFPGYSMDYGSPLFLPVLRFSVVSG